MFWIQQYLDMLLNAKVSYVFVLMMVYIFISIIMTFFINRIIYYSGRKFILPILYILIWSAIVMHYVVSIILCIALIFMIYIFRVTYRHIYQIADGVISPSDGTVIAIEYGIDNVYGYDVNTVWNKIVITSEIRDDHVLRMPIAGRIAGKMYSSGEFKYADDLSCDCDKEKMSILIQGKYFNVITQQISGALSNHIKCNACMDRFMKAGQIYGFLCIGGKLELYIPEELTIKIHVGEKVYSGLTVIANIKNKKK